MITKAFPGSLPLEAFDSLPLDRLAELYGLAVQFLEAEAEAIKNAQGK
ncbi:MAG: hypothetical protein HQL45_15640 [Alphaproteobacteria bacterium]|nr:hypothetical protein [Alphaproteobacteria bacterium]